MEEIINWKNLSNAKIKEKLMSLKHEHVSLKSQVDKLLEKMTEIEKEYYYGNSVLDKRNKGID
jgi:hypothetical protein